MGWPLVYVCPRCDTAMRLPDARWEGKVALDDGPSEACKCGAPLDSDGLREVRVDIYDSKVRFERIH